MTKEFLRFQMVIHIVVALKLVNTKDMESLFGKMEANIKDNTLTVREMDMGFWLYMEFSTQVNGKEDSDREEASSLIKTTKFLAIGATIS